MFRTEMRGHLGRGQPTVDIAGMTETKQVVEHGGAQKAALAKLVSAGAAVALRQGRTVLSHQQADMTVGGTPHAERLQEHDLTRRVGEMIVAAQYLRNSHGGIIDRVAKKERRGAVFAANDAITDVIGR